jgi:hypothetical protein
MLRKYKFVTIGAVALFGSVLFWALTHTLADQGDNLAGGQGKAVQLPIAQVVLFNSGVGYLQREGEVNGDSHVDLTFPTSDVNDLLKSLVLQDTAGGKIGAINYDSQDPIDKILRSFALDLNNNPTFGQILNQARGEKIEVQRQEKAGGNPYKVTGTIVGMELHHQPVDKGQPVEVEHLNLLGAEGMQSIPLTQVLSVRFLNQALDTEFRRALQVLAGAHDVQKKTIALQFTGNGKRAVRVGYVLERPIWKTTYRLVLEPNGKLHMQGWAIVENTSDDDWNNVRMVLVSGKPISYRMDLYTPLYIPRPLVEPELFASLRPPIYDGSLGMDAAGKGMAGEPAQAGAFGGAAGIPGGGQGFGPGGGKAFGKGGKGAAMAPGAPAGALNSDMQLRLQQEKKALADNLQNASQNTKLAYDEFMRRKLQLDSERSEAQVKGSAIAAMNFKEGIQSVATAGEIGDYYQYVIDQKISLPRQKSAMLPIVNQGIEGAKVSIFNEAVHIKYPLLGLRLKNTSGKPLTQGPITVYEEGSYAGDTRILDLQPNEERLLSYAMDQATEVKTSVKTYPAPDMNLRISGDQLTAVYTLRQAKTYTLKNRGTHDRMVIIEHPVRSDWKLVDPKKPLEKTRDLYRFEIAVKSGETVQLVVTEEQSRSDPIARQIYPDNVPFYQLTEGIQVKTVIKASTPEMLSLKIEKGVLQGKFKQHQSKAYFIQNASERDHTFTVDHLIAKEWKRLDKDGKDQVGPAVFHFKLEVKSKQTGSQDVEEQRVYDDKTRVVGSESDDALRQLIANPAPSAKVKAALQQVLDKKANAREAQQALGAAKDALKLLAEDQARVRENLKIVPQTADAYKDFLKKFVAQEERIEASQLQIRTLDAQFQKLQKEYEAYVTTLTVQ